MHKCDYAASGDVEIEYRNDFLLRKTEQFFRRKGYSLNEMQRFCLERQDKNIMVAGQTGMGKTECIGDLNEMSLEEMWNSPRHQKVKELSNEKWRNGECKNCRAMAYNNIINHINQTLPRYFDPFI